MANGTLGTGMSVANNNVIVYTVSSSLDINFASLNIGGVNLGDVETRVRIAISKNNNPDLKEYIVYDTSLKERSDYFERTSICCSPGDKVIVYADTSNVAIRVHGIEQSICSI